MHVQSGAPVTSFCWEPGHLGHIDSLSCAIWKMGGNIPFLERRAEGRNSVPDLTPRSPATSETAQQPADRGGAQQDPSTRPGLAIPPGWTLPPQAKSYESCLVIPDTRLGWV